MVDLPNQRLTFVTNDLRAFRDHRTNIVQQALAQKYSVQINYGVGEEAVPHFKNMDVETTQTKMDPNRFRPLNDLWLIFKYRDYFKKQTADIVHAVSIKPVLYGGLALCLLPSAQRPHFVATFPGLGKVFEPSDRIGHKIRRKLVTVALRIIAKVTRFQATFENPEDAIFFEENIIPDKTRLHPFMGAGVNLEIFRTGQNLKNGEFLTIMFASRPLKTKGVWAFIRAAKDVYEVNKKVRFILAGDVDIGNSDRVDIAKALETEGLADSSFIQFVGHVSIDQMALLLQKADIVCLPTMLREGFPRVLIEAAAAGCALVATDQPSIRQILHEGKNGWFIDPHNQQAFSEKLVEVASDRARVSKFGRMSAQIVSELGADEDKIAQNFLDLYAFSALRDR